MSRLLLRTLREPPGDAEAASHQLLVRAGYIRRLASGVYTFLPLGLRVIHNLSRIVREEMDASGAQEILMPVLQPVELWQQTGRLASMEDILFRVDGHGGKFVLGPTHEEVATSLVAAEVGSWRDLPLNLYQVQLKYRDEARPRFGLLRTREFVMKDAYSFDASKAAMQESYQLMFDAYCRIFERCGLDYTPVEADSGAIGGDVNHEFMVPSAIGEDMFARCPACTYAANLEAAVAGEVAAGGGEAGAGAGGGAGGDAPLEALVEHHTPDRPGIDLVVDFFTTRGRPLTAAGMLKCIALAGAGGEVVVALVPGDREVRVPAGLRPFEPADFAAHPELVKGYIGPMGLQSRCVTVLADPAVRRAGTWVTGANQADHHVTGAALGRDFTVDRWEPIATVAAGDPCPRCGRPLELVRAVEAGHTFQLGLTYSTKIPGATFSDEAGAEQPFWMGCYGIGVSRLCAVVAEQHHDDAGLAWPAEVTPYDLHLVSLASARNPEVAEVAEGIYAELAAGGTSVLYDDRDLSPGVKFADADLLGLPTQVVVGARGLARGVVERKERATGRRDELEVAGLAATLGGLVANPPAAAG